jgi:hypothetical protein
MPVLFAMVGFATGGISAMLYNHATLWIEGIEIDLDDDLTWKNEEND